MTQKSCVARISKENAYFYMITLGKKTYKSIYKSTIKNINK